MAIPIINTADYQKEGKVLVDGNEWTVKLPGAGTSLRMSQADRRIKLLTRKVDDGSATEEDYDLFDKLENQSIDVFTSMFSDGTPENKTVKTWIEETPLQIIMQVFTELQNQAGENLSAADTQSTS